ncbi:FadR/GntR family transcriptional regulator [Streptomyces sp. NPDC056716]|uniref:FadR/GntR family transcriptional regulator n=1 Tax=unclassified Streptomyces TaxID=2593676 RepID=UPI00369C4CAD
MDRETGHNVTAPGGRRRGHELDVAQLQPVRVERLADEVAGQIRRLIIDQNLQAGARLPSERDLSGLLRTSRPTVSQALRHLAFMGLVEIRPGSGAYVLRNPASLMAAGLDLMLDMEPGAAGHLANLRHWLETVATQHVLRGGVSEEALASVDEALEHLERSRTPAAWIAADTLFHLAVVGTAGNPYLASIFESVHSSLMSMTYSEWIKRGESPPWAGGSVRDVQCLLHRDIARALRAQDPLATEAALAAHQQALVDHMGEAARDRRS